MRRIEPRTAYRSLLIAVGLLPALILIGRLSGWLDWFHENSVYLGLIQILSAFFALAAGVVLFIATAAVPDRDEVGHYRRRYLPWVSAGLLCMGILGATASAMPGDRYEFLWAEVGGQLLGGIFFALVWLPEKFTDGKRTRVWIPTAGILVAVFTSAFVLLEKGALPEMVHQHYFSRDYILASSTAGMLFLISTYQFIKHFRHYHRSSDLVFAHLTLLLGMTNLTSERFHAWGPIWWSWHLFQMAGYLIVFVFVFRLIAEQENKIHSLAIELKRSNQELSTFAHLASHDLQEPLRMISSFLTLLSKRNADSLDAQAREYISYSLDGARRLKVLVDGLLTHAKASRLPLRHQPVNVNSLLNEAVRDLGVLIQETHARVLYKELPVVMGDPIQLRRLFENLLQNALRYRSSAAPEILVRVTDAGKFWGFEVADNGRGIPLEYQKKIFELFARGPEGVQDGTGMGLAACKSIVERHGGTIEVRSKLGHGSAFLFMLPKSSPAAEMPAAPPEPDLVPARNQFAPGTAP